MLKHVLTLGVLLLALLTGNAWAADSLAVVVSKGVGIDNLSLTELTKIFKSEKTKSSTGVKWVVIMRDTGSAERTSALAGIFKMTESEYTRYYLQATFTGAVQAAPKALSSGAAVKQFIASTPGAIGYLKTSEIDETVKVIKIDGKSPTDPDYPIK